MSRWCALAYALAGLTLASLQAVRAEGLHGGGNGAILLRYHFVAGQRLVYRVTTTSYVTNSHQGTGGANTEVRFAPVRECRLVRARVVGVNAFGTAMIAENVSSLIITTTMQGRMVQRVLPTHEAVTVLIAPNGTQRRVAPTTRTSPPIRIVTIGTLAPGPVRPGDHWLSPSVTTPARAGGGAVPAMRATVENTLVGFGYADGEPVAIIRSVRHIRAQAATAVSVSGQTFEQQVGETGLTAERVLFGLASGHLVSSQVQTDLLLIFRTHQAGQEDILKVRVSEQTYTQRLNV